MNKRSNTSKVILIGNTSGGKTSIIERYNKNTYNTLTSSTIGVDMVKITQCVDGEKVDMILWDTAGQERYKSIIKRYYTDAKVVLLVFDITQPFFEVELANWIQHVRQEITTSIDKYTIYIVGNKCDLADSWMIDLDKLKNNIESLYGLNVYFTSAKNNVGLDKLFTDVAAHCIKLGHNGTPIQTIKFDTKPTNTKKCCN